MKFVRFGERGQEKPGMIDPEGNIRSLEGKCDDIAGDVLDNLAQFKDVDWKSLPLVDADTRLGACVGQTGKFICIGLNYADHAAESGLAVPSEPVIFMKATSAICGPNDPILIPRGSEKARQWSMSLVIVSSTMSRSVPFRSSVKGSGPKASPVTTLVRQALLW